VRKGAAVGFNVEEWSGCRLEELVGVVFTDPSTFSGLWAPPPYVRALFG